MNIFCFFPNFEPFDSISQTELDNFISSLTFKYPRDYLEFIKTYNGGEGNLGEDYLYLWNIEDMVAVNEVYEEEEETLYKKYYCFASNTGIFRYAFEKATGKIFEIDPYEESYQLYMGKSLEEFLINFSKKTL
jgi:hypothetical protein